MTLDNHNKQGNKPTSKVAGIYAAMKKYKINSLIKLVFSSVAQHCLAQAQMAKETGTDSGYWRHRSQVEQAKANRSFNEQQSKATGRGFWETNDLKAWTDTAISLKNTNVHHYDLLLLQIPSAGIPEFHKKMQRIEQEREAQELAKLGDELRKRIAQEQRLKGNSNPTSSL